MTAQTQPEWATGLIELLVQQRGVYEELGGLSEQQGALVEAGDAEPLLNLLAQRQTLIDRLTQLNGRIEPYKQNWPALWSQLDATTQTHVQSLITQVQSLLDDIVARDERDRAALHAQRERVAGELGGARRGSAVHRAYGAGSGGAQYTDRQG